jgi:integrase
VSVPAPHERLNQPGALLSRSDLRNLGLERRAVDAVFRSLPVVSLPGYARPLVRAEDYMALVEDSTYRAGVPSFSPHDVRHRRISLLHAQGIPWARIGEHVGQSNLAVTANTYSHVLGDETELDYERMLR